MWFNILKCKNNKKELAYYIFSYKFAENKTKRLNTTDEEILSCKYANS